MKSAAEVKKPPSGTPTRCVDGGGVSDLCPPSGHLGGGHPLFFVAMAKAAGLSRKEFQYDLRVSKTLVDQWFAGEKKDPLVRARDLVALFVGRRRGDLVATILAYIAGGDDFDGRILTAEQVEALRKLSRAVE